MKNIIPILLYWLCANVVFAQSFGTPQIPLSNLLNETITFVKNDKLFAVDLEVTVFKPDGAGPFPVLVINHGKAAMNNRLQERARYVWVAREFLSRGYSVVLPMRQGFSNSGGTAVGEGCNITGNGEAQAEDIVAVTRWLKAQAWADSSKMLMMGQSHGGLTTLAYAQNPDPGYKVLVNFAGGLKWISGGCMWEENLRKAFGSYGSRTKVPSLWFYGENDTFFPPSVIQPAHQAYTEAGGKAEFVAYGPFGSDAHGMFGNLAGFPIWRDKVLALMQANGLETKVVQQRFALLETLPTYQPTTFAKLDDPKASACTTESCRNGYAMFLTKPKPRAFALNGKGNWSWAEGGDGPALRALNSCNLLAREPSCKLYAVDDDVVWSAP